MTENKVRNGFRSFKRLFGFHGVKGRAAMIAQMTSKPNMISGHTSCIVYICASNRRTDSLINRPHPHHFANRVAAAENPLVPIIVVLSQKVQRIAVFGRTDLKLLYCFQRRKLYLQSHPQLIKIEAGHKIGRPRGARLISRPCASAGTTRPGNISSKEQIT